MIAANDLAHGQTTATWVNPVSGNWTDSTKWSTKPFFPDNGNPSGTTYNVVFNNPSGSYSVNTSFQPNSVTVNDFLLSANASITLETLSANSLELQSGSLTVNQLIDTGSAPFAISGGSLIFNGLGALNASPALTRTGGGVFLGGTVNATGSTLDLTNTPAGQPAVFGVVHSGQPQSAISGAPFACMLMVQVYSGDTPAEGATVLFDAPAAGASATLDDGQNTGSMLFETTDANGLAAVGAIANGTPGSYDVTATVTALSSGALAPPLLLATFPLTNLDGNEYIFRDGFEEVPAVCGPF